MWVCETNNIFIFTLEPYTKYSVWVKAFTSKHEGNSSDTIEVLTDVSAPGRWENWKSVKYFLAEEDNYFHIYEIPLRGWNIGNVVNDTIFPIRKIIQNMQTEFTAINFDNEDVDMIKVDCVSP